VEQGCIVIQSSNEIGDKTKRSFCFGRAATFPIDLVRRRMQLEGAGGKARVYTSGLVGTFRHIIKTEGWFGLYRGIIPEYYKVIPSVGIVFMTYELIKQVLGPKVDEYDDED
jgi:hypothetical protein